MKNLTLLALVALCGCGDNPVAETHTSTDGKHREWVRVNDHDGVGGSLQIVELEGHSFAVLIMGGRVAVCEVTTQNIGVAK